MCIRGQKATCCGGGGGDFLFERGIIIGPKYKPLSSAVDPHPVGSGPICMFGSGSVIILGSDVNLFPELRR